MRLPASVAGAINASVPMPDRLFTSADKPARPPAPSKNVFPGPCRMLKIPTGDKTSPIVRSGPEKRLNSTCWFSLLRPSTGFRNLLPSAPVAIAPNKPPASPPPAPSHLAAGKLNARPIAEPSAPPSRPPPRFPGMLLMPGICP